MSLDCLFAESTKLSASVAQMFTPESLLHDLLSFLFQLTSSETPLSREENFAFLSCLESTLYHIEEEDVRSKLAVMKIFDELATYLLNVCLEVILGRESELFLSFIMILYSNHDVIKTQSFSRSVYSSMKEVVELAVEASTVDWILATLSKGVHEENVLEISQFFYEIDLVLAVEGQSLIDCKLQSAFKKASTSIRAHLRRMECQIFEI